ncbi:MAG: hypothetical protein K0U86_20280 [Planctomycetes bacterium]|nr:hypothetical protein [Planctomycetota bacterium]MCH9727241.1 hypothetical protein [Planctomycetota bacterium]MCH9776736.1 hypothetical protein [Planctomycetota bacterium]MCH9789336.1 hypothetical protein [Planctomycetota bacterium]MDF1743771.1 hypothetical protein [Gimesia sp.]
MQSFSLVLIRFCLSAWVGAAVIFVITGVQDVTFKQFDSLVRDQLISLHFPVYYTMAWVLLVGSILGGLGIRKIKEISHRRSNLIFCLVVIILGLSLIDYFWIYSPLESMITPPGSPRPAEFRSYHQASKYINCLNILLTVVAAILVNLPVKNRDQTDA